MMNSKRCSVVLRTNEASFSTEGTIQLRVSAMVRLPFG